KTGTLSQLTTGRKLSAPSLSPDGLKICAVEFGEDNRCYLVCIDSKKGNDLFRIESPNNEFIRTPRFSSDGRYITYESIDGVKGVSLMKRDSSGLNPEMMIPYSHDSISSPFSDGKNLYYVSSYSGIDNVYAMNLSNRKKYQITSRPFGAYMPSLSYDGKRLIFSDVTADGYIPSEMTLDPATWVPVEKVKVSRVVYCEDLIDGEQGKGIISDIDVKEYPTDDYSGFTSLFNVHSWYPFFNPVSKDLSIDLISTNILNSCSTTAGYVYNKNEKTNSGKASLSYAGFYPIFNFSGIYGERTSTYTVKNNKNKDETKFYSWKEKTAKGTVHLPLNFSSGLYLTSVDIGADAAYTDISDLHHLRDFHNNNGRFVPITYWINAYNVTFEYGYIVPLLGQVLSASYSHTPFKKSDYDARFLSVDGTFYFPGVFHRNSLYVEGGYERQSGADYHYGSKFLFARGYEASFHETIMKGSGNYTFPLLYPDQNMLWLFYLKQVYINVFGDYCRVKDHSRTDNFRSAGGELMFEINPFNIPLVPFHVGYRFSYLLDGKKKTNNEFVLMIGMSE
ncbi:MAG TPA: hypothetical protein VF857_06000, partial [Spirochaetota bacterium]